MKKYLSLFILMAMMLGLCSCTWFNKDPEVTTTAPDKEGSEYNITLDQGTVSMVMYEKKTLVATVKDADGNAVEQSISWKSSNSSIIVENGVIFAKGAGSAIITASLADGTSATCQVNATYEGIIPHLQLNVNDDSLTVAQGQSFTLQPNVTFNGVVTNDDDTSYFYEVSDESVATVDENGVITAHKTGNVTVTVYGYWRGLGGLERVGGEDAYGLIITLTLAVIPA